MDRRVKERLVGASILMLLIVLIVPELLSGPHSAGPRSSALPVRAAEPVRNVTVDLATSKPPVAAPAMEVPDAAAAAASQAATASAETAPPATAPPATAPPPTAPPAKAASAAAPPAVTRLPAAVPSAPLETAASVPMSKHVWALQLGSFANRANAERLAHELKSRGFSVFVSSSGSRASVRYRVRIGPLSDRAAAAQVLAKLKASGHNASIVPAAP